VETHDRPYPVAVVDNFELLSSIMAEASFSDCLAEGVDGMGGTNMIALSGIGRDSSSITRRCRVLFGGKHTEYTGRA
jgi:hypothetical protein